MLERQHPLQACAANGTPCTEVMLTPVPPLMRVIVRTNGGALREIGVALGVALPMEPCRAATSNNRTALWLGPDEWLVLVDDGTHLPLTHPDASIVDVSHALTGIAVRGSHVASAINAYCALDLHHLAFPPGMCTRTLFGKAQIVLWRVADDEFRIEVARSFAPYVWACLEEARREFLI